MKITSTRKRKPILDSDSMGVGWTGSATEHTFSLSGGIDRADDSREYVTVRSGPTPRYKGTGSWGCPPRR